MGAAAPARTKSERQGGDVAEELGSQRGDPAEGGDTHLSGHSPPPQIRTLLLSPLLRCRGTGKILGGAALGSAPGLWGLSSSPRGGSAPAPAAAPSPVFPVLRPQTSLLVSLSSPTGSGEMELITSQLLEEPGPGGSPAAAPRAGLRELGRARRSVPPAWGEVGLGLVILVWG